MLVGHAEIPDINGDIVLFVAEENKAENWLSICRNMTPSKKGNMTRVEGVKIPGTNPRRGTNSHLRGQLIHLRERNLR